MAFMLGKHLVFLDSFQFMATSLERLAANLPADKFNYTCQAFKGEKLALIIFLQISLIILVRHSRVRN